MHNEIPFEDYICAHLATHGWLQAEGDAAHYDRSMCCDVATAAFYRLKPKVADRIALKVRNAGVP